MSIKIGEYQFEGPYTSTDSLQDRSGVYAILCQKKNDEYSPIDIGESAKVKTRVETHERTNCWSRNCHSKLTVAVLYTPNLQQSGRMEIEQELRAQYPWVCGER